MTASTRSLVFWAGVGGLHGVGVGLGLRDDGRGALAGCGEEILLGLVQHLFQFGRVLRRRAADERGDGVVANPQMPVAGVGGVKRERAFLVRAELFGHGCACNR